MSLTVILSILYNVNSEPPELPLYVQYLFYLTEWIACDVEKEVFQKKINLGIAFSKKVEYLNRKGRRPNIKVSRTRMFQKGDFWSIFLLWRREKCPHLCRCI